VGIETAEAGTPAYSGSSKRGGIRNQLVAAAIGAAVWAVVCAPARADDLPDAPVAKIRLDEPVRTERYAAGSQPVRDGTTFEKIMGVKRGLKSFETPWDAAPLTARQKYLFALYEAEDMKAHVGNVLQSALVQATDSEPHYGQGWGAFAQRYGASEADQATSCFFIYGLLPHLTKTDPRYFRKKTGSVWSRVSYAASRTFITRKDSGGSTFNTPQVLGQAIQSGISLAYYPPKDQGAGHAAVSLALSLLFNSGYNEATEFYPDIWHKVFHRK
jgi:hypothetical protein